MLYQITFYQSSGSEIILVARSVTLIGGLYALCRCSLCLPLSSSAKSYTSQRRDWGALVLLGYKQILHLSGKKHFILRQCAIIQTFISIES